jgi:hypothetical protein
MFGIIAGMLGLALLLTNDDGQAQAGPSLNRANNVVQSGPKQEASASR